jgi:type VI secretion system protein ImpM
MAEAPGWFGKMPALGDFASRRLPDAWREAWDTWLQHALVQSREQLDEQEWLSLYMVAPVRRFWLAQGLLTPEAWIGVLMPSVDSVGRQFPFTLAAALHSGHTDIVDALANSDWLDAADALARQVLDPAFDVEALEQAVAELPALHGERRLETHAGSLLAQELHASHNKLRCAWWCEGASQAAEFLCGHAFPTSAAFMALLRDGD